MHIMIMATVKTQKIQIENAIIKYLAFINFEFNSILLFDDFAFLSTFGNWSLML